MIENYLPYVNSRMAGNTIVCPPFYFSLKLPLPILNFALKMEKRRKENLCSCNRKRIDFKILRIKSFIGFHFHMLHDEIKENSFLLSSQKKKDRQKCITNNQLKPRLPLSCIFLRHYVPLPMNT